MSDPRRADSGISAVPAPLVVAAAAERSGAERMRVLWLGSTPPELLTAACTHQGLAVGGVAPEDLDDVAPLARALVLEVPVDDSEFRIWGARLSGQALAHGMAVALVHHDKDSGLPLMDEEAVLRYFTAVKALQQSGLQVRAFYGDWIGVAKWARDHIPGPGANAGLVLEGDVPGDAVAQLLLRRAFHDFASVSLELLSGGRSGASVWRVRPDSLARRVLPFVVKVHTREKMRAEQSRYFIVRNAVESRLYAPLHTERCVEGHTHAVVVYDVVERATPFRAALPFTPDTLIASLFGQTLNGFRARAAEDKRSLVREFEHGRLRVLRWSDPLQEAAELARVMNPTMPHVETLRSRLDALPPMSFVLATVHGDLHAGNLFVPANSSDVVMIDYGSVLENAPVVADPACLEVSLCFPPSEESSSIPVVRPSAEWRRAAYRYPLDPSVVPGLSGTVAWLPQAVRATRGNARVVDSHPASYAVAVASYLVRFASFDDHASVEERSLAYELACHLLAQVEWDLGERAASGDRDRGR